MRKRLGNIAYMLFGILIAVLASRATLHHRYWITGVTASNLPAGFPRLFGSYSLYGSLFMASSASFARVEVVGADSFNSSFAGQLGRLTYRLEITFR